MKMNLHIKNGSAILKSFNKVFRFRDIKIVRNTNESVCFKITNKVNTITEGNLIIIFDKNFYKSFYQKAINSKHGNPGKVYKLNLYNVTYKILEIKFKETVLYRYLYLNVILSLVSFNLLNSSIIEIQEHFRIHGGKISDKAKILCLKHRHIWQKPNSQCLTENLIKCKRYYSSVKDKSTLKKIKRQLKDNINISAWPNNKTLGLIRKEVFMEQLNLINLANIYGLHSKEVFKKQKILFNSLFFKIIAIDKLSKSKGAQTPGINNIKLTNSKKKNKNLYIKLLEFINKNIKNPHTYKASLVKRFWITKTNGKLRPLGIPTIEDRALQYLINLILEPLVELTSEPHSFGFRPYRSAKYAVAYLKSLLKTKNKEIIKNTLLNRTLKTNYMSFYQNINLF